MKAVVCQNAELSVRELPDPVPQAGQVLLKVLRCGICGSDLHMRHHCDHMGALMARTGYHHFPTASQPLVMGHEFCGEVLEQGAGTARKLKTGTRVCAMPVMRKGSEIDMIGLSSRSPGAYAERIVVDESMLMPIPNGLPSDQAALTEPMAVALHAVNRSQATRKDVAIVVGCGPVGLAVVAMLKARGVATVVASDFSPKRRELARLCGADVVINPAENSPFEHPERYGFLDGLSGLLELGMGTREKLGKLPLPWWQVWRLAEKLGLQPKRPIIFECVGVPGMLQRLIDGAPLLSRIMVVGYCMEPDRIEPAMSNNKEIDLRFCMGYSPLEYRDALHLMAEGKVKCAHLVTGTVGLGGVASAFDALRDPERHAKILIDPASLAQQP
ncbi:zinc-binding dehydrogenase [Duganella sp. LX20W]|uniref:Zinc-binding dehydrogenase n=1 Tax=Rugamonas brunnea TaxID=2758569 RepID=A0A7W2IDI0_9BURK|nr:zinc-binding dehydrogenase [Rugamonas brunnea]MBA5639343.1 zinc-binding dehydrogenase [Rugamonas brunnea]